MLGGATPPRVLQRLVLWMAAGALVPLLGVVGDPCNRMPGTPRSDLPKHIWSYWHTLHHLAGWPNTTAIGAPSGGELLDVMLLPATLLIPVTAVMGPVFASSLWVWLSLVLVGVCTGLLALRVVGSERSAVVAGLVTQLAPYLAGYPLGSGVHERLAIWVFPLVWLGLLSWKEEGRRRALVGLSVGLFFATAGCQVYGVFVLGMLLFGLPIWWPGWRKLWAVLVALGGALGAAWLLVSGPTASVRSLVPQTGRLELWPGPPRPEGSEGMELRDLLDPTWVASQGVTDGGDELYLLVYLGWVCLLLAIAGAWQARGRVAGLVAVGLALATLAFGPVVVLGSTLSWNPVHVTLSWMVPVFRSIPVPWQALGATMPLLGVGVGAAVDRIPGHWAAAVAVALVALERAVVLPVSLVLPTFDTTVPEVYEAVTGPVLEMPRIYRDTTVTPGQIFLAQIQHEQPIALTINAGVMPLDFHLPTLRGVSSSWRRDAACWGQLGFAFVMLHRDWLSPSVDAAASVDGLSAVLGEPVADDGVRVVFAIPQTRRWTDPLPIHPGSVADLLDRGLVGQPPPALPHRNERCPVPGKR